MYDCLIGHKDLQNLEANINYKTQIFSTSKFEINYFKNIPDDHKNVKMNHHQGIELQIRTDHMNKEERDKIKTVSTMTMKNYQRLLQFHTT